MLNKSLTKNVMPHQDPKKRIHHFEEVALGYTHDQAVDEAKRCLDCKHKPCINGCPVGIDIPAFIGAIIDEDLEKAYDIISNSSLLPSVCGRVCPQETQCEAVCVRGLKGEPVAIGHLERFVADAHYMNLKSNPQPIKRTGPKIAVVGSGPAGLSCAHDLAKYGYEVHIFEALHTPGGVLRYGIPEFRLPKIVLDREIEMLALQGVLMHTNVVIGQSMTIDDLFQDEFKAIFLGTGAGLPKFLGVPGEMLNGVYSANEFLTRVNLMKAYDQHAQTPIQIAHVVAVIGGGNVALDAARCAKRLGAKTVYLIYRRSMKEIPARHEEVLHAQEEGIIFKLLTNLTEIIGDDNGFVKKIQCVDMILGEPDASGRARPIENKSSQYFIDVESVIMAIGTTPNPLITQSNKDIDINNKGCIVTKSDDGLTSKEMVFAGGDAVTGSATVILAMGAGKKAAKAIDDAVSLRN